MAKTGKQLAKTTVNHAGVNSKVISFMITETLTAGVEFPADVSNDELKRFAVRLKTDRGHDPDPHFGYSDREVCFQEAPYTERPRARADREDKRWRLQVLDSNPALRKRGQVHIALESDFGSRGLEYFDVAVEEPRIGITYGSICFFDHGTIAFAFWGDCISIGRLDGFWRCYPVLKATRVVPWQYVTAVQFVSDTSCDCRDALAAFRKAVKGPSSRECSRPELPADLELVCAEAQQAMEKPSKRPKPSKPKQ